MKMLFRSPLLILASALLVVSTKAALPIRASNTSLTNLPANPPAFGFSAVNAFGTITFTNPVAISTPPGETNRLFVVEQGGRIAVITNLANPTRTTFLNVSSKISGGVPTDERGLLGLAFHPGYATNRYFFIFYTSTATGSLIRDRLSRFTCSVANSNAADAASESILIDQVDEAGNHNAGDLHFGPDGYLYVSLGDEGNGDDTLNNSQRLDKDFFSGILRIDVDKRPGNLAPNTHPASSANYSIPIDNPFIGATNLNGVTLNPASVRTEFWAIGLRNPWRTSFDPVTGQLYVGDVGQGAREEVDVIVKGGNYGWYYREGKIQRPGSGTPPVGFSAIDPILDYDRNTGSIVIGGVVYRGTQLAQLSGAYIFGDAGSGRIWMLRHSGTNILQFQQLLTEFGVVAYGVDPRNGDVLMANQSSDTIRRLVYNSTQTGTPLPATLAATGAFADLATLSPNPGIVPYDLNVPFWSDHAIKRRWFSVPNTNLTLTLNADSNWFFPTGTVWIKHFDLELTNGVPASRQRLETRLLVRNADGVYGLTYRWGTNTTNAVLVPEGGTNEDFTVYDGATSRVQTWRYPSRAECLTCHTAVGGLGLGFNTAQLNRDFDYGGTVTNQLRTLSLAGYFSNGIPAPNNLRALAHPTNTTVGLEYRVRSYLAANCVQCHQPGGTALGNWDARISNPLSLAGLVNGPLVNGTADPANRVIVPGDTAHSMLLSKISQRGPGQMPPLGSTVLDTNAVALVTAWITTDLTNYQTFAQWQFSKFGSINTPNSTATDDFDGDGSSNFQEYLLGTNPLIAANVWKISLTTSNGQAQISFPRMANRGFEVQGSTNVAGPWQPLDLPGNRVLPSAVTSPAVVEDSASGAPSKFYRIRTFEP